MRPSAGKVVDLRPQPFKVERTALEASGLSESAIMKCVELEVS